MVGRGATPWGEDTLWGRDLGADTRTILWSGSEGERYIRQAPHPAVPELDRLRAFRRALADIGQTLFCRRLLILLSCRYRVEEDKDTASAVSDTDDSARCVWVGIGRSGPVTAGSLA